VLGLQQAVLVDEHGLQVPGVGAGVGTGEGAGVGPGAGAGVGADGVGAGAVPSAQAWHAEM